MNNNNLTIQVPQQIIKKNATQNIKTENNRYEGSNQINSQRPSQNNTQVQSQILRNKSQISQSINEFKKKEKSHQK